MKNITLELDIVQADLLMAILRKEIAAGGFTKTAMYLHEQLDAQFSQALDAQEPDQFRTDAEADGDALASAGFGTDEDYGHYGSDE